MTYFRHIDGLRALAVLSVLFFHLDSEWLPGGFIGVDIFFVISGFLISSIILSELDERRFTLSGFYLRRVRRILPALFVVIAAVLIAGALLLPPLRLADVGGSAATATASVSNIFFWAGSGYFDSSSLLKPLLHTWSLSVEEQLYLVWPAFLLLFHRSKLMLWLAIGVALIASLAAMYLIQPPFRIETYFYLTPYRVFEFAMGATAIALRAQLASLPKWLNTLLTLLGFLIIGYALARFSSATLFPGLNAAVPCLGAMLLICCADRSFGLKHILEAPAAVAIGKVSYSGYLVHWPFIVFYSYVTPGALSLTQKGIALLAIVAATLVLYFAVERPIHHRKVLIGARPLLAVVGSAAVLLLIVSSTMWRDGWPWRFSSDVQTLMRVDNSESSWRMGRDCFLLRKQWISAFDSDVCLRAEPGKVNVLLIGDSHAARFMPGLVAAFPEANIMQATAASCRPIIGDRVPASRNCQRLLELAYGDEILDRADYVILSGRWTAENAPGLQRTLLQLRSEGRRVILLGPVQTFTSDLLDVVFLARDLPTRDLRRLTATHASKQVRSINRQLRNFTRAHDIPYVDFVQMVCTGVESCNPLTRNGQPIMVDNGHITADAAIQFVETARDRGMLAFPMPPRGVAD